MQIATLTTPSKTFLLGEYAVLSDAPALVLNTNPRFQLTIFPNPSADKNNIRGIEMTSPAGRYIQEHQESFKDYCLEFKDPHQGQGGFGASTAQFAMVVAWCTGMTPQNKQWQKLLDLYQKYAWQGQGLPPSGADLMAQITGGVTLFWRAQELVTKYPWPFAELAFCLIRTNVKVATHQHLAQLKTLNTQTLVELAVDGVNAFKKGDANKFVQVINSYADTLQQQGLVAEYTLQLLATIKQQNSVIAAKGCGALGADVILVIVQQQNLPAFKSWLVEQKLKCVAAGSGMGEGLAIADLSLRDSPRS